MDGLEGPQQQQGDLLFSGLFHSRAVAPQSPPAHAPPRPPLTAISNRTPYVPVDGAGNKLKHCACRTERGSISGTNTAALAGQSFSLARISSKQPHLNAIRRPSSNSAAALLETPATAAEIAATAAAQEAADVLAPLNTSNTSNASPPGSSNTLDLQLQRRTEIHTGAAVSTASKTLFREKAPASDKSFRRRSCSRGTATEAAAAGNSAVGRDLFFSMLTSSKVPAGHLSLPLPTANGAASAADGGLEDLLLQDSKRPTKSPKQPQQPQLTAQSPKCLQPLQCSGVTAVSREGRQQQRQQPGQQAQQQGLEFTLDLLGAAISKGYRDRAAPYSTAAAGIPVLGCWGPAGLLGGGRRALPLGSAQCMKQQSQQQQMKPTGMLPAGMQTQEAQQQPSKELHKLSGTIVTATSLLANAAIATAMPSRDAVAAAAAKTTRAHASGNAADMDGSTTAAGQKRMHQPLQLLPLPAAVALCKKPLPPDTVLDLLAPLGRPKAQGRQVQNTVECGNNQPHRQQLQLQQQQQSRQRRKHPCPVYKDDEGSSDFIGLDSDMNGSAGKHSKGIVNNTSKQQQHGNCSESYYQEDNQCNCSSQYSEPCSGTDAAPSSSDTVGSDYEATDVGRSGTNDSGSLWSGSSSAVAAAAARHSSSTDEPSDDEQSWLIDKGQIGRTAAAAAAKRRRMGPTATESAEQHRPTKRLQLPQLGQRGSLVAHMPAAVTAAQVPAVPAAVGVPINRARNTSAAAVAPGDPAPGEVPVLLPSAAALSRQQVILVELPGCFDITGDSGAIGRVLCSRATTAAASAGGAAHDVAVMVAAQGSVVAKLASKGTYCGSASSKGSMATVKTNVDAKDAPAFQLVDSEGKNTDNDSDDGFAQQLNVVLRGQASNIMTGLDCGSQQESDAVGRTETRGEMSEDGVKEDDRQDVTAIGLDLKGLVFSTQVLPLAGTAAVVRINMPGNKSKDAVAHVEHLFSSNFVRAATGLVAQQQLDEDMAAFDCNDDDDGCYAAAQGAEEADEDEQQQRTGKRSSCSAHKKGKGGSKNGGRAGRPAAGGGNIGGGIRALRSAKTRAKKVTGRKVSRRPAKAQRAYPAG